jgi:transposase
MGFWQLQGLGVMSGSCAGASPETEPTRRFEVFTGAGRRRQFSLEEKLALVAQMATSDNISALARSHDLRPSQLFTWRRELRYVAETAAVPAFVPAVVAPPEAASEPLPLPLSRPSRQPRAARKGTAMEVELDGARLTIAHGTDPALVTAALDALQVRR